LGIVREVQRVPGKLGWGDIDFGVVAEEVGFQLVGGKRIKGNTTLNMKKTYIRVVWEFCETLVSDGWADTI
jgi:hypothetical protein